MANKPAPPLHPSEAILKILSEIERYSEAVGLIQLVESLKNEADGVRREISLARGELARIEENGRAEIDGRLQRRREAGEEDLRKIEAKKTRAATDLKNLLQHIENVKAAETERIEDLKTEHLKIKAARKALAEERRDFEGLQKRLARK